MLRSTHLSPRRGWRLTRDELKRDVQLLLGGSYEAQPTAVAIHGSFTSYVLMAASSQFTYDPTWALWMPNGYTSTLQLWQAFMARWFASDIWRTLEGHSRGSGGWTKDTDGFLVNIERSNSLLFAMFLILEADSTAARHRHGCKTRCEWSTHHATPESFWEQYIYIFASCHVQFLSCHECTWGSKVYITSATLRQPYHRQFTSWETESISWDI
jgi:hypothetical protein